MQTDTTHSILKSAQKYFSGTMLSRFTGLARDMLMAYAFGVNGSIAAFLLAFRLSHILRRILGEGALQTAFTPLFEEIRAKDQKEAYRFFGDLTAMLMLLLAIVITLTMGGLGLSLLYLDLNPGNREVATLTFWMMPSLFFICLYGMNASFLQCEKSYFTPSFAPVGFNLAWIGGILLLWDTPPPQAVMGLTLAINLACFAQWALTVPKTQTFIRQHYPQGFWRSISIRSANLKKLLPPLLLAISGIIAIQINTAIDGLFARYAEAEGPALLWYASRIEQLPLALFGIALSTAILPPLARAIKTEDMPAFRRFLQFGIQRCLLFMVPITIGIFLFGLPAIEFIYGHGDFSASNAQMTYECLCGYGIGLVPSTLVLILAPAFYARGEYKIPTIGSLLCMGSNTLMNSLLIFGFGMGAVSVAYATSLSAFLNAAFLMVYLHRAIGLEAIFIWPSNTTQRHKATKT